MKAASLGIASPKIASLRIASLRIAWAGPWNVRSAIATFGVGVVAALAGEGHAVEVLRSERGDCLDIPVPQTPWPEHAVPVHRLADVPAERRRATYDVVIANLGDHFGYHGALVPLLAGTEAVVIFHDCFLANYCAGWAQLFPDPEQALRAMVRAAYGPAALPAETPYWQEPAEMMRHRPMVELLAGRAAGAVVHARHYLDRVARVCPGPVAEIPLSFRDLHVPPPALGSSEPGGGTLTVATIGHINANKQITEVIKAIGSSERLRARCRYLVIGAVEPEERQRIEAVMRVHDVSRVEFTGWVDDETVRDLLTDVDAVCCLRYPILEGGSASVIVAMLSARAVLVSDHGVYGELPDDVVLKCRPGAEAGDVARHLEALLADRPALLARGARARAFALREHAPARYARDLLALVGRAVAGAPAARTGGQFGRLLASFGLGPEAPAAQAAAGALVGMLGASADPGNVGPGEELIR